MADVDLKLCFYKMAFKTAGFVCTIVCLLTGGSPVALFITGNKVWLPGVELGWERFCLGDPCSFTGTCLRVHT